MVSPGRFATLLTIVTCVTHCSCYVSICYFTSWSLQRSHPSARIAFDDIDPNLCTHLVYAFANIDLNGMTLVPASLSQDYDRYSQFNQLKQRNPNLRTVLSVGGENSATPFVQLSRSADSIAQFSKNAATFLVQNNFDGLDVDWEFPDQTTKSQYSSLLKGLRQEFNKHFCNGKPLLLTAAVSAGDHVIKVAYDIPEISRHLDYILIMTYDFFGTWSTVTGFNSPLFTRASDPRFSPLYNVEHAVNLWVEGVTDRGKVILGMTGAGASFTLSNASNNGVGVPVQPGGGQPGDFYQYKGRLIYPEICKALSEGWTRMWDEEQQVPYAFKGVNWVGYDDRQSIARKAEYAMERELGGVMFWELSFDDPQDVCRTGRFPLLNAAKNAFNKNSQLETPRSEGEETTLSEGEETTRSEVEETTRSEGKETTRSEGEETTRSEGEATTRPTNGTEGSTENINSGPRNRFDVLMLCPLFFSAISILQR